MLFIIHPVLWVYDLHCVVNFFFITIILKPFSFIVRISGGTNLPLILRAFSIRFSFLNLLNSIFTVTHLHFCFFSFLSPARQNLLLLSTQATFDCYFWLSKQSGSHNCQQTPDCQQLPPFSWHFYQCSFYCARDLMWKGFVTFNNFWCWYYQF